MNKLKILSFAFLLTAVSCISTPSITGADFNMTGEEKSKRIALGNPDSGDKTLVPGKTGIDPGFLAAGNPNIDPGIRVLLSETKK